MRYEGPEPIDDLKAERTRVLSYPMPEMTVGAYVWLIDRVQELERDLAEAEEREAEIVQQMGGTLP